MKTFYLFFICHLLLSVNIYSQLFPNDLLVNIENQPSTFVQKNPQIFPNGSKGYLSVWEDYRDGDAGYYAQAFDSLNNKIGNNFQIDYQADICFNNSNGYLGIHSTIASYSVYFPATYTVWGKFYDQNNQLISAKGVGGGWLPDCGMGWLGIQEEILSFGDEYLFLFKFSNEFSISKFDNEGNNNPAYFQLEYNDYAPIQFSSAINLKGEIFLAWKAVNIFEYDSLAFYTAILDSSLNYICEPHQQSIVPSPAYGSYEPENNWHTVVVSDSLFELFKFDSDSMKLTYQIFDNIGNIYQDLQTINLPKISNPNVYARRLNAFSFSPIIDEQFQVLISFAEYADLEAKVGDFSILYNFDGNGTLLGEEARDTLIEFKSKKDLFKSADGYNYFAADNGADVYTVKHDKLSAVDSIKINDDQFGSNERYPSISKLQYNEHLITWSEPSETFGRKVNSAGVLIGDEIKLDGKEIISFGKNCNINFWAKQIGYERFEIGFSKFDDLFNMVSKSVADTINNYRAYYSFKSFDDSSFVYCYINKPNLVLRKYNLEFNIIAEDTLAENITYVHYVPLFKDENSFWVNWNGLVQKYSFDLEPNTSIINLGFSADLYLGNNNFLDIYTSGDGGDFTFGKIISVDGSIVNSSFILADSKSNVKVGNLTTNEFISTYHVNDNFYLSVFDNLGELLRERVLINESIGQKTMDGTFKVNGDEIYFAWSDTRIPQTGYDVFVNALNVNTLVNINRMELSIPDEFSLSQNYPNPFNPTTKIKFKTSLFNPSPYQGEGTRERLITLKVYDILGNEIATLLNEKKPPGEYEVEFDGSGLTSGVYFYRLKAGNFNQSRKLLLLK